MNENDDLTKNQKYIVRLKRRPTAYKKNLDRINSWKEQNPDKQSEYQKKYRSTEHYKELKREQNKRYRERQKQKSRI